MCNCNITIAYICREPHSQPINKCNKANGRELHRLYGVEPLKGFCMNDYVASGILHANPASWQLKVVKLTSA